VTPYRADPPEEVPALHIAYAPLRGPVKFTRHAGEILWHTRAIAHRNGWPSTLARLVIIVPLFPLLDVLALVVSVLMVPYRFLEALDQFLQFPRDR